MKNLIAAILFILSAFFASGQAYYNDSREDVLNAMQRNMNHRVHIAAEKITSVQTFGYKRDNPVGSLMYESKYDSRGNITDWITYKQGKVKSHNSNTYDDSSRVTQFAYYKGNSKLKVMSVNIYDKAGNEVEQDYYWKNPKIITSKIIKIYDKTNNITEAKTFDKKGILVSRIEYTYYDDGSKKRTTQYSDKGKVLRVWNFDCNPVGKLQAKKFKDTSKICVHYETDKDGNPIKIKEEYKGEKGGGMYGKTIRSVSKFDKNNNLVDAADYNLNGKQLSHWSATYNKSGKIAEYIIYKDGTELVDSRTTYTYNSDGNVEESLIYKQSAVPVFSRKYVYISSMVSPGK